MNKELRKKSCLLLLEFGIPHYRIFIYQYFQEKFNEFKIIHSGEIFDHNEVFKNKKCWNLKLFRGISICVFNFFQIKNYDIIISTLNFRKPHTWIPFFIFCRKKWIFWGQGVGKNNRNIFLRYLRKVIINHSSGYVVYTDSGKRKLIQSGIKEEKISIAYNTLRIKNSVITSGNNYLLYVGRIQKRKGLIKVLQAITDTRYKFVIVGDGKYGEILKQFVESHDLTNQVFFRPAIYDENELKIIFSDAIAYISPDHVGLGVVHSFAYGVPIITCQNRYHAPEIEYCNISNSYLYQNDNELKSVIEEVFNNPKKRNIKGKNAYLFYKNKLDPENVYKAFDYHFDRINTLSVNTGSDKFINNL